MSTKDGRTARPPRLPAAAVLDAGAGSVDFARVWRPLKRNDAPTWEIASVDDASGADWAAAYAALIAALPEMARSAALTLCGMSACIDARIDMHDMAALLRPDVPAPAAAFAEQLLARAARGVGGEMRVEWPEGPAWLAGHVRIRTAMGGTGPHAAWVLSTLGAPALLALEDRSEYMLSHLPPDILLAEADALVPARCARPRGERRPEIFIFEYTAGRAVGGVMPPRSSRIIVRFNDPGLEHDAAFDRLTRELAGSAGAGLVAGFQCEPPDRLGPAMARVFGMTRAWRAAGLPTIHLELAGGYVGDTLKRTLAGSVGAITSLGMSQSELLAIEPGDDPLGAMVGLGERYALRRVAVHADHWAAAVTLDDPARERHALMTGCLLASARAAAGIPVTPAALPPAARFSGVPFPERRHAGPWQFVACAAPYLAAPATTLGLGDSFTAGCLLGLNPGTATASARPAA